MDNSIYYLNEKVKQLHAIIERYSYALRMHAVTEPRDILENAVRRGFPEDIYREYMVNYWESNEASTERVIEYINKDFIPYLKNVSYHLQQAMNEGPGSTSATSVLANPSSAINPQSSRSTRPVDDLAFRTQQLMNKAEALEKNYKDLEKALGIKRGPRMSVAEADKQNANPKYTAVPKYLDDPNGNLYRYDGNVYLYKLLPEDAKKNMNQVVRCRKNPEYKREFSVNCATCAAAYVLRLRGFDVKAKGNPEEKGNLNTWLSECHSFDIWKNVDGSQAKPTRYVDWMQRNGSKEMSADQYRRFFEESCKEEGVYIVTVKWRGKGAHATILQRDKDGLHYIEPQVYDEKKNVFDDGRRSINELINGMDSVQPYEKGVMRVDDKLFKIEYANLFEI